MVKNLEAVLDRLREGESTVENLAWWGLKTEMHMDLFDVCIKYAQQLVVLHLDGNNVGPQDCAQAIVPLLMQDTSNLAELSLSDNGIDSQQLKAISNALRVNRKLRRLNLAKNNICNNGMDYMGFRTLCDVLDGGGEEGVSCNTTLLSLDVSNNFLGDTGALWISNVVENNVALLDIDMGSNQILDNGQHTLVESLGVGLTNRSGLSTLNLVGNLGPKRDITRIRLMLQQNLLKRRTVERYARKKAMQDGQLLSSKLVVPWDYLGAIFDARAEHRKEARSRKN